MRMPLAMAMVFIIAASVATACERVDAGFAAADDPAVVPKSVSTGPAPGTLISATPLTDVESAVAGQGRKATRMAYHSTSGIDQSSTIVTGVGFIPPGTPPHGGWPIVALAHGSTGINPECGPSRYPNLLGLSDVVANLLIQGRAVAVTDYQGLGGPGAHPYLDSKTAGLNVIDSVRALKAWSPDVSSTWAAYGISEGGAAAWAANEMAYTYAPELRLVGSVSIVPAVDVSQFPGMAAERTLNNDQMAAYVWLLAAMAKTRPGFDLDLYRHDIVPEEWEALLACTEAGAPARLAALSSLAPEEMQPVTPDAQNQLTSTLTDMALPKRRASAPMLVFYGGLDVYLPPEWIESAIKRACAMGSRIAAVYQPDKGHGDIDTSAVAGWLSARFNGDPAPSTC